MTTERVTELFERHDKRIGLTVKSDSRRLPLPAFLNALNTAAPIAYNIEIHNAWRRRDGEKLILQRVCICCDVYILYGGG